MQFVRNKFFEINQIFPQTSTDKSFPPSRYFIFSMVEVAGVVGAGAFERSWRRHVTDHQRNGCSLGVTCIGWAVRATLSAGPQAWMISGKVAGYGIPG